MVDQSLHLNSTTGENVFATITIYAKRFEDMPLVRRLGDVVRVHRATVQEYKGYKQFNVNVFYNSSFCLFSTYLSSEEDNMEIDEGDSDNGSGGDTEMQDAGNKNLEKEEKRRYIPYKYSGRNYSFDIQNEKGMLDSLREWS